jgi:hypothetical protein
MRVATDKAKLSKTKQWFIGAQFLPVVFTCE